MIYERIKGLCEENGISVNSLEKEIGFARGSLCKIDKHKPSYDKIQAIAGRLNSSFDYIIKGENSESTIEMAQIDIKLSNMEKIIKEYALKLSKLPKDKQENIMSQIDMLADEKDKNNL